MSMQQPVIMGFDLHQLVEEIGSKDQVVLNRYIVYFNKELAEFPNVEKHLHDEEWQEPKAQETIQYFKKYDEGMQQALRQLVFGEKISYEDVLAGKVKFDFLWDLEILPSDVLKVLIFSQKNLFRAPETLEPEYYGNAVEYFWEKEKLLEGEEKKLFSVFTSGRFLFEIQYGEFGNGFLTKEEAAKLLYFLKADPGKYKNLPTNSPSNSLYSALVQRVDEIVGHGKDLFYYT